MHSVLLCYMVLSISWLSTGVFVFIARFLLSTTSILLVLAYQYIFLLAIYLVVVVDPCAFRSREGCKAYYGIFFSRSFAA